MVHFDKNGPPIFLQVHVTVQEAEPLLELLDEGMKGSSTSTESDCQWFTTNPLDATENERSIRRI